MSDTLYRYEIPDCPLDTDGDGDCAMCARQPDFHRRLVEVPTAVVPWCAEHNAEYSERLGKCWVESYWSAVICRVEEPARHYVIGEAE